MVVSNDARLPIVNGFQLAWMSKRSNLITFAVSGNGQRLLTCVYEDLGGIQLKGANLVMQLHSTKNGAPIGRQWKWHFQYLVEPMVGKYVKFVLDQEGYTALMVCDFQEYKKHIAIMAWSCEAENTRQVLYQQKVIIEGTLNELKLSPNGEFFSFVFLDLQDQSAPERKIRITRIRKLEDRAPKSYTITGWRNRQKLGRINATYFLETSGIFAVVASNPDEVYLLQLEKLAQRGSRLMSSGDPSSVYLNINEGQRFTTIGAKWFPTEYSSPKYVELFSASNELIFATTHHIIIWDTTKKARYISRRLPDDPDLDLLGMEHHEFKYIPDLDLFVILGREHLWLLDCSYSFVYRKFTLPVLAQESSIRLAISPMEHIQFITMQKHNRSGNSVDMVCYMVPFRLKDNIIKGGGRISLSDAIPALNDNDIIGSGAYGTVYKVAWKCHSIGDPLHVVVKVMNKAVNPKDEKQAKESMRLQAREVAVWKNAVHESIVPFIGTLDETCSFLVSQWMPNGTARDFFIRHPRHNRIKFIEEMAKGLAFLHGNEIVHSDLKAINILVDESGSPRLADFGISYLIDDSTLMKTHRDFARGTLRWMSPELMLSELARANKESDIYAFAMTAIEIITGEVPFFEKVGTFDTTLLLEMSKSKDFRPTRPQCEECNDSFWKLLANCWVTDPSKRWQMDKVCKEMKSVSERYRPLRILTIDHSYARMSAVFAYLETLETQIQCGFPCDLGGQFDLICGSAFGGFIALLLGILGLTIDDCYAEYLALCLTFREISGKNENYNLFALESLHDEKIEQHVEELIIRYGHKPESSLEEYQFKRPRVLLIGNDWRRYSTRRSYRRHNEWPWMSITLLDAFMHSLVFPRELNHTNPSELALEEAREIFGRNREIACLISLGLGHTTPLTLKTADRKDSRMNTKLRYISSTKTNVQNTHIKLAKELGDKYFRFDVKDYLERLSDTEFHNVWDPVTRAQDWRALRVVGALSEQYMRAPAQKEKVRRCLQYLVSRKKLLEVRKGSKIVDEVEQAFNVISSLGN